MDVCVVGAGPAGLTVALVLARAGRSVALLDSGDRETAPEVQELNDGDVVGDPHAGLRATRQRGIGGTVNAWNNRVRGRPAAKHVPLDPRDLDAWPITWDELAPHYEEAQRLCGLGPFEYGADRWAARGRAPFALDGTGLTSGVYQFGYAERFTRDLVSEVCATGLATLVPSTTVVGLVVSGRRVQGVRVAGPAAAGEVRARAVVLACGAVENARLLLLAGQGDGGGSSWLGRGFMEHARDFSLALVPSSPDVYRRASFYDLFESEGVLVGGRLAPTDDAMDALDLPNASVTLVPRARSGPGERLVRSAPDPLRRVLGLPPRDRYGWARTRLPGLAFECIDLVVNVEQWPDPSNRVELGTRRDRFGNPLPLVALRWTDAEQERLERLRVHLAEGLRTAGIGELRSAPGARPDLNAHHHAGTTRMASAAEDGVVDPDGRVFGLEGVWVAGASVFPTAGYANPTLTIVAVARRLGMHLAAALD